MGSPQPLKETEHYYVLEVSPDGFKAIEGIANMPSVPQKIRQLLQEAVKFSYRQEGPLARLRFEWLEMEAKRQGCSWEDVLFDRAHAKGEAE